MPHNVTNFARTYCATTGVLNNTNNVVAIVPASTSGMPIPPFFCALYGDESAGSSTDPMQDANREPAEVLGLVSGSYVIRRLSPIAHAGAPYILAGPDSRSMHELFREIWGGAPEADPINSDFPNSAQDQRYAKIPPY